MISVGSGLFFFFSFCCCGSSGGSCLFMSDERSALSCVNGETGASRMPVSGRGQHDRVSVCAKLSQISSSTEEIARPL
jgi:hypothetical protein